MHTTPIPTPTRPLFRTIGVRGLALGLIVLAPGLIGCSTGGDEKAADADAAAVEQSEDRSVDAVDPEATGAPVVSVTVAPPADADSPGEDAGASNGGGGSGGVSTSGGDTAPSGSASDQPAPEPVTAGPVITGFETPDDIDCHNGDFQEFTARWTTTGATKVTISIDGPGIYAEYAANGEASLPFTCTSAHSFLLTAHGSDGRTATSTVTLQPRNVQVPQDEQADDEY